MHVNSSSTTNCKLRRSYSKISIRHNKLQLHGSRLQTLQFNSWSSSTKWHLQQRLRWRHRKLQTLRLSRQNP